MEQHYISSLIRRHYRQLIRISTALDGKFAEKDVHAFRVEVKKLRALLRLTASAHESHSTPVMPQRLHTFYKMTGEIRNLQVQRKSLIAFAEKMQRRLPAAPTALLDERIHAAVIIAQQYMDKEHPFDEKEKLLASLPQKIDLAAMKKFIRREMKPFRSLANALSLANVPSPAHALSLPHAPSLAHSPSPETAVDSFTPTAPLSGLAFTTIRDEEMLHTLRKSLEDLVYTWPMMDKRARNDINPAGQTSKKGIALLSALLGDFRDCCLCLSLFQDEDFLFYSGQPAKPFLQSAADTWLQDKKTLLEKINRSLLPAHRRPYARGTLNGAPNPHVHAHRISTAAAQAP